MSQRTLELALKKRRLQSRSAELRQELAGHVTGLSPLVSLADAGAAGVSWLRRHPEWALGVSVILLLALGPRRVIGFGMRLYGLAQVFFSLRLSLVGLISRHLPSFLFRSRPSAQGEP